MLLEKRWTTGNGRPEGNATAHTKTEEAFLPVQVRHRKGKEGLHSPNQVRRRGGPERPQGVQGALPPSCVAGGVKAAGTESAFRLGPTEGLFQRIRALCWEKWGGGHRVLSAGPANFQVLSRLPQRQNHQVTPCQRRLNLHPSQRHLKVESLANGPNVVWSSSHTPFCIVYLATIPTQKCLVVVYIQGVFQLPRWDCGGFSAALLSRD